MTTIDVFYQGEGLAELEHIEVGADHTFNEVKALIVDRHGLNPEVLIFLEDCAEPPDGTQMVRHHAGAAGVKVHVHRCRHVEVTVHFNGQSVQHHFGPGTTIARVKRWAAEHKFGMSQEEAGEHVLQITGTQERPAPGTHLGALAACPNCRVAFDLVPDQRVNGGCCGAGL